MCGLFSRQTKGIKGPNPKVLKVQNHKNNEFFTKNTRVAPCAAVATKPHMSCCHTKKLIMRTRLASDSLSHSADSFSLSLNLCRAQPRLAQPVTQSLSQSVCRNRSVTQSLSQSVCLAQSTTQSLSSPVFLTQYVTTRTIS